MMSRIAKVELFPVMVPFRRNFALGNGMDTKSGASMPVCFVRMETDDGCVGWGEQRPNPHWSYETIETMISVIRHHLAPIAIGMSPFDVAQFHLKADTALRPAVSNGFPFAKSAMDMAFHDLAGKLAGVPLHALFGGALVKELPLCSALGADSPKQMAEWAKASGDYAAYKVKITGDVQLDIDRVLSIADVIGNKPIWLDANQSYQPGACIRLMDSLKEVPGIACIEQPVASHDWNGMERIRERSRLPIAVDEGCFTAADLAKIIRHRAADMVVLKVCKAGGLRQCLDTAAVAKANGLELLASGLTDCGIAFAASLHVFSTLNFSLPIELNGPELLENMLVHGLEIDKATVKVPSAPGIGVEPDIALMKEQLLNI